MLVAREAKGEPSLSLPPSAEGNARLARVCKATVTVERRTDAEREGEKNSRRGRKSERQRKRGEGEHEKERMRNRQRGRKSESERKRERRSSLGACAACND